MGGYLEKQDTGGRYGVSDELELTCGDRVEVMTALGWAKMRIEHDGIDYFLVSNGFSFYPRKVYARKPR